MRASSIPAVLLLAGLLAGCGGGSPPNVLLVTVDTLRADAVGAFGGAAARTPRLDALAAEGVRYTRCWSPCPLTVPSHATILTGLLPPEHGLRDNSPPRGLAPREIRTWPTLAEALRERGYATGAFTSASVLTSRTGLDQGFDVYAEPSPTRPGALSYNERPGGETADLAVAWIENASRPFFAFVHLFDPHDPYLPPVAWRSGAAPGTPEAYADEVSYADSVVGRLVDALADAGVAGDTLVIVTADHGEGLGEHGEPTHGYLLFETTLHVPLIARWPDRIAAGSCRDELVSLGDLFATILAAAGGPASGVDLLADVPDRVLTAESLYGYRHMGWAQQFAAREGERKAVRGAAAHAYDLSRDPREEAPDAEVPRALSAAIDRHRALSSRVAGTGAPVPEMAGFPYASGVGASRLEVIPDGENALLREPDPGFAEELDRAKSLPRGETAERAFARLASADPGNPSVAFWHGRYLMAGKDFRGAADAFSEAFRKGLREARVLNLWLQQILLAEETGAADLAEIAEIVATAVPGTPPDAATWVFVGEFHRRSGDPAEAARCADRAERLATTDAERQLLSRFRHNLNPENDK